MYENSRGHSSETKSVPRLGQPPLCQLRASLQQYYIRVYERWPCLSSGGCTPINRSTRPFYLLMFLQHNNAFI